LTPFDIVVAADADRGIARGGALPWNLPGDLAHFKQITTYARSPAQRNVVIMGRGTWDSIPARFRPLAGRINVVVSRQPALELPRGVHLAGSLDGALSAAEDLTPTDTVFVVGGGQLYAEAVRHPACRRIYYTRIAARFECETFFPPFEDDYVLESVLAEREENGIGYRIEVWGRREE
jgi:dihydrofolate reductase